MCMYIFLSEQASYGDDLYRCAHTSCRVCRDGLVDVYRVPTADSRIFLSVSGVSLQEAHDTAKSLPRRAPWLRSLLLQLVTVFLEVAELATHEVEVC